MTTYKELAARMIAEGEGLVLVVYDDANGRPLKQGDTIQGHPTIGYGRNLAGKGITQEEAEALLSVDLIDAEDAARGFVGGPVWRALSDVRRAVLIDMAHNLGATRLYQFAKLRGALERSDFNRAADEIEDSAYFRQVKSRGERNRDAMRSGRWGVAVVKDSLTPEPKQSGPYVLATTYAHALEYWTGGSVNASGQRLLVTHRDPAMAEQLTDMAAVAAVRERYPGLKDFTRVEAGKTLEAWGE